MSTSSDRFANLIAEFPGERDAVVRLAELLADDRRRDMTAERLADLLSPNSFEALIRILERLVAQHALRRVYRVESPGTNAPIDDFTTYEEIPDVIEDWHTGRALVVTPRNLRVIFSTP